MPLIKGSSPDAKRANIRTELAAGRPPRVAVAIAMSEADQALKKKRAAIRALGGR